MTLDQVAGLIGFVGLVFETIAAWLLVLLFMILRRHARRRPYFRIWGWAWVAIGVALTAVVIRYLLLPALVASPFNDRDPVVRALYFVYQFGKLVFFLLLAAGTAWLTHGKRAWRHTHRWLLVAGAYALLSVWAAPTLTHLVVWQSPAATVILAFCAYRLFTLAPSRRSLGSLGTACVLSATAVLWVLYFVAFSYSARLGPAGSNPFALLVHYNSYFDLMLLMLLGYGMVVLLLEDAKREVDAAHAELGVAHDRLRRAALYDALTGSLNRRAFVEGIGLEAAGAAAGTLVVLDMDNMKEVNDTYGHPAGDALLRHLVEVLRGTIRSTDRLYRWGGDEFLVILPGGAIDEATARIGRHVAAANDALGPEEARLRLEVSLGAAEYVGAERLTEAIERADRAMYAQKLRRRAARVPLGD